jgi:hypothetical protein
MRGNSIVVACVASGVGTAPVLAYALRSAASRALSFEDWLVSALTMTSGPRGLWAVVLACAGVALFVGLILKDLVGPIPPRKEFELRLLRTPIAAALLAPLGVATIVLFACNHTPQAIGKVVWPELYRSYVVVWSILSGIAGAALACLLNDMERTYEKAKPHVRAGIACFGPVAICFGLLLMAGMVGGGLLAGSMLGQARGCPTVGGWTAACIAAIFFALGDDVLWPAYFPTTRLSTT